MKRGAPRITSKTRFFSKVLYSGRFRVPWHQRHYDWTTQEVDDLLHDLKDALDAGKTCYFLGSIMLLEASGDEPQRINDGQQRLITFSLMMSAFCRRFAEQQPLDTGREMMALRALFDRSGNEVSRLADAPQYTPRIVTPRNDRPAFTQIICGSDIGSNGPLMMAWRKIDRFVSSMDRETRKNLFDFLLNRVEVSVLTVPKDVDANRVFETLNGRGKNLSETDLRGGPHRLDHLAAFLRWTPQFLLPPVREILRGGEPEGKVPLRMLFQASVHLLRRRPSVRRVRSLAVV